MEKAEKEDQLKEIWRETKRETKRPSSSSGDEEEEELRKMKLNPTPKKSSGSSDYRMYKTDPQEHSVC